MLVYVLDLLGEGSGLCIYGRVPARKPRRAPKRKTEGPETVREIEIGTTLFTWEWAEIEAGMAARKTGNLAGYVREVMLEVARREVRGERIGAPTTPEAPMTREDAQRYINEEIERRFARAAGIALPDEK